MTEDPGRTNIADQRFAADAALRYLAGRQPPRTFAQWLALFREHYGDAYRVSAPSTPGSQWKAAALFGEHDQLSEWSAEELLEEILHHHRRTYPLPETDKCN